MSARLTSRLARPARLSAAERAELFAIYARHYDNADPGRFERDLDGKDYVIVLLERASGRLQGFSTQQIVSLTLDGRLRRAIFSGDTVIDRSFWGEQELVRSWCRFAGQIAAEAPGEPLHWFLITKGYRTYLYLPLFFRDYHPRFDAPTPAAQRRLMDALALSKFADRYDASSGLITGCGELDRLVPELARTPPSRLADPRVAFYLDRNPRWDQGEELVSLTEVAAANMRGLARRMFEQGLRQGPPAPQAALHA